MIFTWDYNNLCIVFRSWRITSAFTLVLSLLAVMALTAGYEAVREASRRYEARQSALLENMPRESLRPRLWACKGWQTHGSLPFKVIPWPCRRRGAHCCG